LAVASFHFLVFVIAGQFLDRDRAEPAAAEGEFQGGA